MGKRRRARFRRPLVWAIVAAGGLLIWALATLPPEASALAGPPTAREDGAAVLAGAIHVHTHVSDGTGTPEEVAEAAARAGLQFVIFTDHGDGTRVPRPSAYHAGVLCLDAVEISTTGGHYLALGLGAAPYPLAGEPADVVEDVARFGGFGIVAHPDSAKPALRWRDWSAPFDGIEWLNADSEWRNASPVRLVRAFLQYPLRQPGALASLFERPVPTLARWDALTARRRIVGVAGADAHARIGLGGADPYQSAVLLRLPSYETVFRSFTVRAVLDAPLSGDAATDAPRLLAALREGRTYSAIDALASPGRFELSAQSGRRTAAMGEELLLDGPVRLRVAADAPPGAHLVLLRDGVDVAAGAPPVLEHESSATPGVFRAEVRVPGAPGEPPVPWIVGNPVYVLEGPRPRDVPPRLAAAWRHRLDEAAAGGWRVEHSVLSRAAVGATPTPEGQQLAFRWALGRSVSGEYAAAVRDLETGAAPYDRLTFRGRADRPMRVSVQIRLPGGPDGERWRRSVYLDAERREVSVFFDELVPAGATSTRRPDLRAAQALLVVVDTTNTPQGSAGVVWLEDLRLEGTGAAPEAQVRTVRSR